MAAGSCVFTIGHSNHPEEAFLALLSRHGVDVVGDVRSSPYSRMYPHFNREGLKQTLQRAGMRYVYLGDELGARSPDPECYAGGRVQFGRIAQTESFRRGLRRVREGMLRHRIALMCAEKEPLDCHRTILVARRLVEAGTEVVHIHADGALESHAAAMERLARALPVRSGEMHLFRSESDLLADVYTLQEERIAYRPAVDEEEGESIIAAGVPA